MKGIEQRCRLCDVMTKSPRSNVAVTPIISNSELELTIPDNASGTKLLDSTRMRVCHDPFIT